MKILLISFLFSLTLVGREAILTWGPGLDNPLLTMYNVYRAEKDCLTATTFVRLNFTPISPLTYTDPTIKVGDRLCYYVTSTFNGLESDPSEKVDAVVKPGKPTSVAVK